MAVQGEQGWALPHPNEGVNDTIRRVNAEGWNVLGIDRWGKDNSRFALVVEKATKPTE